MEITFKKTKDESNRHDISNIEMTIESHNVNEIVEQFTRFLRACGYDIKELVETEE